MDKIYLSVAAFSIQNKKLLKLFIFIVPILFLLSFFVIKINSESVYGKLVEEDSSIEYLQALFYFLSSLLAFFTARLLRKNDKLFSTLYYIIAAGLLIICLEEISWGQRIFGVETPQYFEENNYQKEISVHNISMFQKLLTDAYIIVGLTGMFAFLLVPSKLRNNYTQRTELLVPSGITSLYFLPVLLFYLYRGYIQKHIPEWTGVPDNFIIARDQEAAEFILTLGFLMFFLINHYKLTLKVKANGSN